MRISDWSSDVCSSDLKARASCFGKGWARQFRGRFAVVHGTPFLDIHPMRPIISAIQSISCVTIIVQTDEIKLSSLYNPFQKAWSAAAPAAGRRSEEHTSELQSLMRRSYAVFCLKKKKSKST